MFSPVLNAVARLLNRSLVETTSAQGLLAALEQKSLAINVLLNPDAEPIRIRFLIEQQKFCVLMDQEPATTSIRGTPLSLLKLSGLQLLSSLTTQSTHIDGDVEVARRFELLFKSLHFDVEATLAEKIGDKRAYLVNQAAKRGAAMLLRQLRSVGRQSREFLTEEAQLLTPTAQVQQFSHETARLRDDAERLQARLRILAKRLSA
jgi:ubiquinone biosynthesis protein UbiJ